MAASLWFVDVFLASLACPPEPTKRIRRYSHGVISGLLALMKFLFFFLSLAGWLGGSITGPELSI